MAGMAFFGASHIVYTLAFGLTPFGLKEFLFTGSVIVTILCTLPFCAEGVFRYAVAGYAIVIWLMGWRVLARFNLRGDIPWRKIYAAGGVFLFVVSDITLAVNKFCRPIPVEREIVMVTYYAAQLCISLSAVNSRRLMMQPVPGDWRGGRSVSNGATTHGPL